MTFGAAKRLQQHLAPKRLRHVSTAPSRRTVITVSRSCAPATIMTAVSGHFRPISPASQIPSWTGIITSHSTTGAGWAAISSNASLAPATGRAVISPRCQPAAQQLADALFVIDNDYVSHHNLGSEQRGFGRDSSNGSSEVPEQAMYRDVHAQISPERAFRWGIFCETGKNPTTANRASLLSATYRLRQLNPRRMSLGVSQPHNCAGSARTSKERAGSFP